MEQNAGTNAKEVAASADAPVISDCFDRYAAFLSFVAWDQLRSVLKQKEVTSETLCMSIPVNLLIAFIIARAEVRNPTRNVTAAEGAAMLARGIWTNRGSVASAMLTALLRSRLGLFLRRWISGSVAIAG
jgi:hypothetical protein